MSRRYSLFGLCFESDIALPHMPAAPDSAVPDVRIRMARLGDVIPQEPGLHRLAEGDDLLCIDGVSRYRCRGGCEVLVEPHPGARPRNVRLFLLGSAMGLLLHQRGLLPLHGNSIAIGGGATVFLGPSGAGKSTLAAWFHDHGFAVCSDDVSVVTFDHDDRPRVSPGPTRLRLWREVLESSGRDASGFSRSFVDDDEWGKYDVPASAVATEKLALSGAVLLEQGEADFVEPLTGVAAAQAFITNTYRGDYLLPSQIPAHWAACIRLARTVPVWRWQRRWGLEDQVDQLLGIIAPQAAAQVVNSLMNSPAASEAVSSKR